MDCELNIKGQIQYSTGITVFCCLSTSSSRLGVRSVPENDCQTLLCVHLRDNMIPSYRQMLAMGLVRDYDIYSQGPGAA